jgi:hypothetical protein
MLAMKWMRYGVPVEGGNLHTEPGVTRLTRLPVIPSELLPGSTISQKSLVKELFSLKVNANCHFTCMFPRPDGQAPEQLLKLLQDMDVSFHMLKSTDESV